MYEEVNKVKQLTSDNNFLRLEVYNLKTDLRNVNNRIDRTVEQAKTPLINEINLLKNELKHVYDEINRLKDQIKDTNNSEEQNYLIDKLNNQINKDSTNSSIPTSKESIKNSINRRTNTYNHRVSSNNKIGAQFNHVGKTFTKQELEKQIKENNLEVIEFIHYIDDKKYNEVLEKYKVGMKVKTYVEKHIFIPSNKSDDLLQKDFYSVVTYCNDLKSIIILFGNYCFLPYNKIKELISYLTNNIINLSEGTIDNFYSEFSIKCEDTLLNITNNLLNGKYQHTDETVARENGKDSYYRGYANKDNVLYKYHNHKGDKPIEDDEILPNFYGTLITDHDVGIFKYGANNQDCIVHFGRYCIEQNQNITVSFWKMKLYNLLLKFEKNRQILSKYKVNSFKKEEIKFMEEEYDNILEFAKVENDYIPSTYWKEKPNTLLNSCIKYKKQMLFYIYDFTIPYENNFMERALRMIKSKTKVSGRFRSFKGGVRFGKIMSVIKTSKLRNINPFYSIINIMDNKTLFA